MSTRRLLKEKEITIFLKLVKTLGDQERALEKFFVMVNIHNYLEQNWDETLTPVYVALIVVMQP